MAPQINKRRPVSCENCRKRKIKCPGTQPPCESCVRRGVSGSCVYLRNVVQNPEEGSPSSTGEETALLVQRIRELEARLHLQSQQLLVGSATSPSLPLETQGSVASQTENYEWNLSPQPSNQSLESPLGYIFISPAGYQRFVPRAFRSSPETVNIAIDSIFAVEPLLGCDETNFPFDSGQIQSRKELLACLPPARQCDELKEVFFRVFSPLFHILHDPIFNIEYARFRDDANSVSLTWLGLLFTVLSVAVTALGDSDPLLNDLGREKSPAANIRHLASRFRNAAMRCLSADKIMWRQTLHSIQTLVLLIYALYHAHGSCWPLLGFTQNIAVAIGFHVDPDHLELAQALHHRFDAIQSEMRRRCWAGLKMLYTVQSINLGAQGALSISDNVRLPADVNDQDLLQVEQEFPSKVIPTQMSYILFKFRLYEIAEEICQYNFDSMNPNRNTLMLLNKKIAAEQESHNCRFLPIDSLPTHHIVHLHILNSYSSQLYIVLHRPFLIEQGANIFGGAKESRERCQQSALTILAIHKRLFEAPEFQPYRWYNNGLGSFQAFLAAAVLVVILKGSVSNQTCNEIRTVLYACLSRFRALSSRSDICAKATPVLEHLLHERMEAPYPSPSTDQSPPNITPSLDGFQDLTGGHETWEVNEQLLSLVTQTPPQQWFSPASFSWDQWGGSLIPIMSSMS